MDSERHDDHDDELVDHDGIRPGADRPGAAPGPDRSARRRRPVVLAVAVAVLAAGAGGGYWAVAAGGDGGRRSTAGSPLKLDGANADAAVADRGGADPVSGSGGSTVPGGPANGSSDPGLPGGGRYLLTGTLPEDGPKSAAVYLAKSGVGAPEVRRLAALLKVGGQVTAEDGWWHVGPLDGTGPTLMVDQQAPGTWKFARNEGVAERPDRSSSTTRSSGVPEHAGAVTAPADPPAPTDPPVSEQRARAVTAPLLKELHLSGAGARIDARETTGPLRLVSADPVVGGLPTTGLTTSIEIGAHGTVTGGYGQLSAFDKGDSYPVVTAAAAFKELSASPVEQPGVMHPDHTTGDTPGDTCMRPLPAPQSIPDQPGSAQSGPAPSITDPSLADLRAHPELGASPHAESGSKAGPTNEPGPDAIPTSPGTLPGSGPCKPAAVPPTRILGAEFGLSAEFTSAGRTLVPAWLFEGAQAGVARTRTIAQQAVDPAYVQQDPAPATVAPAPPATPVGPGGPTGSRPQKLAGYRADGDRLTLTFWGGVCDAYRATAEETGGQVRVSVTATPTHPRTPCPALAKSQVSVVTLAAPLGGRSVVDASDGGRLPQTRS